MINSDVIQLRELLRQLIRKLGLLDKSQLSCCGITYSQCHALVEIGSNQSLSINELAELLGLDKSTLSRTVNTMVEQGLVTREPDPDDRRYVKIKLTPTGSGLLSDIEDKMTDYYLNIYQAIPQDKRKQVLESLELLVKIIKGCCC
ncbi:MAG: MarR family winged helix-turn-helix transcriptional regulator [Thermoanaerobacterales bacterium]|nr:MarR family winged helix-turn-helix transcriptional regulator [Thermoanaerobacterales bacterium]